MTGRKMEDGLKSTRDRVIDVDFRDFEYTEEGLERYKNGTRRFFTAKEFEARRDRVLGMPLP